MNFFIKYAVRAQDERDYPFFECTKHPSANS